MKMKNEISIVKRHWLSVFNKNEYIDILLLIYQIFDFTQEYIYQEIKTNIPELLDENSSFDSLDKQAAKIIIESAESKWCDVKVFLELIDNLNEEVNTITIATEENYIDRDYRDSYYMHFSEEHFEMSRFCRRVLLFNGDFYQALNRVKIKSQDTRTLQKNFIGSLVIRPLVGCAIGRTLISPQYLRDVKGCYLRTTEYTIYYRGITFLTKAFPYRMQDMVTSTCAEITIMNVFDYYSKQYVDYKYILPSDIYQICRRQQNERVIPTNGMTYELISRVFYEAGFSPRLYIYAGKKRNGTYNEINPMEIISYYVESGMPVAIGLDQGIMGHSIVCIGHGEYIEKITDIVSDNTRSFCDDGIYYINTAEISKKFVFQDDSKRPYVINEIYSRKNKGTNESALKVNCIVAPLHRRMYMDAHSAKEVVMKILDHNSYTPFPRKKDNDQNYPGQTKNNPIVFRLFLASSRHFKESRLKTIKNNWLYELYQEIPLPNFIWVCELYSKQGYLDKSPFGEIVLDATSSAQTDSLDSCLLICYPNRVMAKNYDGQNMVLNNSDEEEWTVFKNVAKEKYMFSSYNENLHLV